MIKKKITEILSCEKNILHKIVIIIYNIFKIKSRLT